MPHRRPIEPPRRARVAAADEVGAEDRATVAKRSPRVDQAWSTSWVEQAEGRRPPD
jgi:hypothetical protein